MKIQLPKGFSISGYKIPEKNDYIIRPDGTLYQMKSHAVSPKEYFCLEKQDKAGAIVEYVELHMLTMAAALDACTRAEYCEPCCIKRARIAAFQEVLDISTNFDKV